LILQQVAEKMVAKPRREQRSSTPLGNALVAAGGLFGSGGGMAFEHTVGKDAGSAFETRVTGLICWAIGLS